MKALYSTNIGSLFQGDCVKILEEYRNNKEKFNMIFTSPPFPLNRSKKYGNMTGEEYLNWIGELAPIFSDLIIEDGSIVIEIGNAFDEFFSAILLFIKFEES